MGNWSLKTPLIGAVMLVLASCGEDKSRKITPPPSKEAPKNVIEILDVPSFDRDSAYAFVEKQVAFGPRVPNTESHKACADWLTKTFERFGLKTTVQKASVTAYNNEKLSIFNIMGQWKPELQNRILLCAHWDTRPYADRDTKDRNKPIDGANDGGSGVGVLIELARVIAMDSSLHHVGIDFILFDAEDYGKPQTSMFGSNSSNTWCLGSQYWAKNIPFENYRPRYGILLDMVGAPNAVFPRELKSVEYAPDVVDQVWNTAHSMGYKDYFSNVKGNPVIDDHIYLNSIAKIPTIDIIHYDMFRNDFGSFHHTHDDNMDGIDATTLGVVGEVLLQVLYQENKPS
ncbi:MAG: M28 family peptidase [Salibacteraceae bacterium]